LPVFCLFLYLRGFEPTQSERRRPSCLFETDVYSKDNILGIIWALDDNNLHKCKLITSFRAKMSYFSCN